MNRKSVKFPFIPDPVETITCAGSAFVYARPLLQQFPPRSVKMFTSVTNPVSLLNVNEPVAVPHGVWGLQPTPVNTTSDSVKVIRAALAAVDPANAAYAPMIDNAISAALSFDFMIAPVAPVSGISKPGPQTRVNDRSRTSAPVLVSGRLCSNPVPCGRTSDKLVIHSD